MAENLRITVRDFLPKLQEEWERKTLLDFLRTEIARIESNSTRPGWTVWALSGSLAALVSYLLTALGSGMPRWQTVGAIFVLSSVAWDCLNMFWAASKGGPKTRNLEVDLSIGSSFVMFRPFMVVWLARILLVYAVYLASELHLSVFLRSSFIAFLLMEVLVLLLFFVVWFFRCPMLKSGSDRTSGQRLTGALHADNVFGSWFDSMPWHCSRNSAS